MGYNHNMKTRRTVRIIALIIFGLVFSPLLSMQSAQAMVSDSSEQHQTTQHKSQKVSTAHCKTAKEKHECKHCAASSDSSCCQHDKGGSCNNSCTHGVLSAVILSNALAIPVYHQAKLTHVLQLTHSIDPDLWLRPPQSL